MNNYCHNCRTKTDKPRTIDKKTHCPKCGDNVMVFMINSLSKKLEEQKERYFFWIFDKRAKTRFLVETSGDTCEAQLRKQFMKHHEMTAQLIVCNTQEQAEERVYKKYKRFTLIQYPC